MSKFIVVFFCLMLSETTYAQLRIKGVVIDASSKKELAFVNIGIKYKNIGTVSTAYGAFSIDVPRQFSNDTLTFSMIGYEELSMPVGTISDTQKVFLLEPKDIKLREVSISGKKPLEKFYGLKHYKPLLHFMDGSTNQNDAFEIAQLIKLDKTISKITSVNLHINETGVDSAIFRINFYNYDGHRPTDRAITFSIVQKLAIKPGWVKFDLSKYPIFLKGDVVAAIEFIPDGKKNNSIKYEIKPGGHIKSFVRTSSLGIWQIPPHQYRMFVTALVSDDVKTREEDETDMLPNLHLFSKAVNDSFSIFVRLPKNYENNKGRKYKTIYMLDANLYFSYVNDSLDNTSGIQPILLGIGYSNFGKMDSLRNRDYTYPLALASDSFNISGGGDRFYEFINKELVPYIDSAYRTDKTCRTLMGHSLGGYFTLYALYRDLERGSSIFKNYVAASPSLEYHDQYLQKQFEKVQINTNTAHKTVCITWGSLEENDIEQPTYVGIMNSFVSLAHSDKFKNIKFTQYIYPGAGHMETAISSFYFGIKMAEQ